MRAVIGAAALALALAVGSESSTFAQDATPGEGMARAGTDQPAATPPQAETATPSGESAAPARSLVGPALALPTSVEGCLGLLEQVIEQAESADLLDDQIDAAEKALEEMDTACRESRYTEALASAEKVVALVSTNK